MMTSNKKASALFDPAIIFPALKESFRKLDPRHQIRNPVMFVVEIGSILTTGLWLQSLGGHGEAPGGFIIAISLWLWFTVIFANFAEAMAEGRGKAQAANLRKARQDTPAKRLRLTPTLSLTGEGAFPSPVREKVPVGRMRRSPLT